MIAFLSVTPVLGAPVGPVSLPTGGQVLSQCQRAYDSVQTLEEDVSGSIGAMTGTAHIRFKRPGKLRVGGRAMFGGGTYDLISANGITWLLNGGIWSQPKSAEMGIATITGVSANAGTVVPSMLMHTSWGSVRPPAGTPMTVAMDSVAGHRTFRVTSQRPVPMTRWIDASTYFLVRTEVKVMDRVIRVNFGPVKANGAIPDSAFRRP